MHHTKRGRGMVINQQALRYLCTEQMVPDERGGQRRAYRFQVFDEASGELLCAVDDVCTRESDARALEELFRRNRVAFVHVMDVLEDWLP